MYHSIKKDPYTSLSKAFLKLYILVAYEVCRAGGLDNEC